MDKVKLNHFILWCKGWYECVNPDMDIFDKAVTALKLDDYICCERRNVIGIVTNYIDELIDKDVFGSRYHYLRLHVWSQNISHNMQLYNVDYETATLITIKHFFAYHVDTEAIKLVPPIYSRKLYKMGFVCPRHFGNSYRMCNYKVKKFFKS